MRGDTLIRNRARQEVFRSAPPRLRSSAWGWHPSRAMRERPFLFDEKAL